MQSNLSMHSVGKSPHREIGNIKRGVKMTMGDELEEFLSGDREIVVVMVDGRGFRGRMTRYDDEVVVLKDVKETLNEEPSESGIIQWRKVLHSKLIIRLEHVLRVWPWDAPKAGKLSK